MSLPATANSTTMSARWPKMSFSSVADNLLSLVPEAPVMLTTRIQFDETHAALAGHRTTDAVCGDAAFDGFFSALRRALGDDSSQPKYIATLARRGYRIVGTSTSCTHTLKAEYREMLDVDDSDATVVAQLAHRQDEGSFCWRRVVQVAGQRVARLLQR